jgi:hypothetical protein
MTFLTQNQIERLLGTLLDYFIDNDKSRVIS